MTRAKGEEIHLALLFEKQLKGFLERLGKYDDFAAMKINCENCNKPVTLDNLGYVALKGGEARFYCDSPDCMKEVS